MTIEKNKSLDSIIEILNIASREKDLMTVKDKVLPAILEILNLKKISIGAIDVGNSNMMRMIYTDIKTEFHEKYGIDTEYLRECESFEIPMSVYPESVKNVINNMQRIYFQKLDITNREQAELKNMIGDKFQGLAIFPMILNNKGIGLISFYLTEGEAITDADIEIIEHIAKALALMIEIHRKNEIISAIEKKNKEFAEALDMQRSLMSVNNISFLSGARISFNYQIGNDSCETEKLKSRLGGDYYEAIKISDSKALLFFADVMGHGVMSNYFVPLLKGMFKMVVWEDDLDPAEILTKVSRLIFSDLDCAGMFITCRVMMIDFDRNEICSANAGHTIPLLYSFVKEEISYLDKDRGKPLGIDPEYVYEDETYDMDEEAILFMYTDGIYENTNINGQTYKESNIIEIMKANKYSDSETICNDISEGIKTFVINRDDEELDDMMIVLIKNF